MAELTIAGKQTVPIELGPTTVGTEEACTVTVHRRTELAGRHFVIQPHETGHILKNLAAKNPVKVNGQACMIHKLVDGDMIRAGRIEIEYTNFEMPAGAWEAIDAKKGKRSSRYLLPLLLLIALIAFGFHQWQQAGTKRWEEAAAAGKNSPIDMSKAKEILEGLPQQGESGSGMDPEAIAELRAQFMAPSDGSGNNGAEAQEMFAEMFGGEGAGEVVKMDVPDRMFTKDRRAAEEALLAEIFGDAVEETTGEDIERFERLFAAMEGEDRDLVDKIGGNLAALQIGGSSIDDLPITHVASLRFHESQAVVGYTEQGHRDESWDTAALTAIQLDARLNNLRTMPGRTQTRRLLVGAVRKALDAGCRDPQLLMIRERLVKDASIDLPFEGSGTPLENAVLIIESLETYTLPPLLRAQIYRFGIEAAMEKAREEGELSLKHLSFDVWMHMPKAVVKHWDHWIDAGIADVVAGAPSLGNPMTRDTYASLVREILITFAEARADHSGVAEALQEGLSTVDGGQDVAETLAKVGQW